MEEKTTLRGLKTSDIYKMSKILKKMNIKLDVGDETTQMEMGVQMFQRAIENLHMAEDEVNEFLGDMAGMSGEAFGELPLEQASEVMEEFKKQPGLKRFFMLVSKSMK